MNFCPKNNIKLQINNIEKSFEDMMVIKDVSLSLKEGELVSLMGLSGSGKSTVFNIIAGLLLPDKGSVIIEGKDYTGKTGRVSYMYQKDLLLPWKKIIDNVSLPFVIKGSKKNRARNIVKEYFKVFGLEGFEDKYPFQLSGGMRQRAALLRTYMFSKDIMLLDEPFGGLDQITKRKMQDWLVSILKNLNASVLFITHDVDEAIYLSDRIYILSDKPAQVKKEIIVDLNKSAGNDLTTSIEFNKMKRDIIKIL